MGVGVEPTVYGYNSHFQRFLDTIFTFIIGANRWLSGTILSYKETIKKKKSLQECTHGEEQSQVEMESRAGSVPLPSSGLPSQEGLTESLTHL